MKVTELDSWEGVGVKSGGGVGFFIIIALLVLNPSTLRNPYSEVGMKKMLFTCGYLVRS